MRNTRFALAATSGCLAMSEEAQFKLFLLQEQQGKKRLRSARTVATHMDLLKRLKKHVPDLSPEKIKEHLSVLFENGRKGTYLNAYVDVLHMYGRYLDCTTYTTLRYFPEEQFVKATMSDTEIEAFLALDAPLMSRPDVRTGKMMHYRYAANRWQVKTLFWKILAFTGMRPGEVAHLTVDSVDFGQGIFIVTGKTGPRIVPIAKHLTAELTTYIQQLTTTALFPSTQGGTSRQGGVMSDVVWGYDFHQRIKRLGIKRKNLTPYSLRHSFITRMLDEGINLYPLQNIVGHKQGSPTTSTYYHMATKTMARTLAKDPLSRSRMDYNQRFEQFRTNVRQLLSEYAQGIVEEKKMLMDLLH
jgi:integrase